MIEVRFTLLPKGDKKRKRLLGIICIANDGTGTTKVGNYNYAISHTGKFLFKSKTNIYKKGKVKGFPRNKSVYRLLSRIFKDAGET